ncbi:hypothetical protein P4679_27560 [Priestia megaterium]|uniref:hypothetical protein n=1 Tax=Priestia megaterium TaxID=1404 RepID=UPI002E1BD786|nr:hypothetical protein [Priestia megaterium]
MAFSELLAVSLCAFAVFGLCIWYYIAFKRSESELERIVKRDLTYEVDVAYASNSNEEEEKENK